MRHYWSYNDPACPTPPSPSQLITSVHSPYVRACQSQRRRDKQTDRQTEILKYMHKYNGRGERRRTSVQSVSQSVSWSIPLWTRMPFARRGNHAY